MLLFTSILNFVFFFLMTEVANNNTAGTAPGPITVSFLPFFWGKCQPGFLPARCLLTKCPAATQPGISNGVNEPWSPGPRW